MGLPQTQRRGPSPPQSKSHVVASGPQGPAALTNTASFWVSWVALRLCLWSLLQQWTLLAWSRTEGERISETDPSGAISYKIKNSSTSVLMPWKSILEPCCRVCWKHWRQSPSPLMTVGAVVREKGALTRVLWDRPWVRLWKKGMHQESGAWHTSKDTVEMGSLDVGLLSWV